jgi:hypothetical protein
MLALSDGRRLAVHRASRDTKEYRLRTTDYKLKTIISNCRLQTSDGGTESSRQVVVRNETTRHAQRRVVETECARVFEERREKNRDKSRLHALQELDQLIQELDKGGARDRADGWREEFMLFLLSVESWKYKSLQL